jgi:hypothetical protein
MGDGGLWHGFRGTRTVGGAMTRCLSGWKQPLLSSGETVLELEAVQVWSGGRRFGGVLEVGEASVSGPIVGAEHGLTRDRDSLVAPVIEGDTHRQFTRSRTLGRVCGGFR